MADQPRTRIYLARHGQSQANVLGRFCGHADAPLTPRGVEQARALGRRLAGIRLDACYASDLTRALETARLALGERGLAPAPDPALREIHYGEWELVPEPDARRTHPDCFAAMEAEDPAWQPPGGETLPAVVERTGRALDRIIARHRGQSVLVVSHGTAINCLLAGVLGLPLSHVFRIDVANCALFELEERNGRLYAVRLNDTAHLEPPR
ncbi:histidine phosphatase family protein [Tepidiforma sp.]|uniref:histidine phosphatase family protein n=1 Tax=Tepidiforma sp. TaxID=2682230 RepID=UPI002ADE2C06|nr:histidine phosphatase family protein [Tepidiforma sp.]